jgi:hypothetical protein
MSTKKAIKEEITNIIQKKSSPYTCILYTPDCEFLVKERNKPVRSSTEEEARDILEKYPDLKAEVFTIKQEVWDRDKRDFVRISEPVLPELLRNRCRFIDFDGPHRITPYIQSIGQTGKLITIKDPKEHKDSQGMNCCDAPGIFYINVSKQFPDE